MENITRKSNQSHQDILEYMHSPF